MLDIPPGNRLQVGWGLAVPSVEPKLLGSVDREGLIAVLLLPTTVPNVELLVDLCAGVSGGSGRNARALAQLCTL